jgi:hypothetical protein
MKLSTAEKLQIASQVAPRLRDGLRSRPIKTVAPDGTVVREVEPSFLVRRVLDRAGIELDGEHTVLVCDKCGLPFRRPLNKLGGPLGAVRRHTCRDDAPKGGGRAPRGVQSA